MSDQAPELPEEMIALAFVVDRWEPPPGYSKAVFYDTEARRILFNVYSPNGGYLTFGVGKQCCPDRLRVHLETLAVRFTRETSHSPRAVDAPHSYREALLSASRAFYEGIRESRS